MIRSVAVPKAEIPNLWPLVEPYLQASIDRGLGDINLDDIATELAADNASMVLAIRNDGTIQGVAVLQMYQQPDQKLICKVVAMGGEGIKALMPILEEIEQCARRVGAAAIRFHGRLGWTRILPDYALRQVVLEKDLRH